jgi:hypothetical protein
VVAAAILENNDKTNAMAKLSLIVLAVSFFHGFYSTHGIYTPTDIESIFHFRSIVHSLAPSTLTPYHYITKQGCITFVIPVNEHRN